MNAELVEKNLRKLLEPLIKENVQKLMTMGEKRAAELHVTIDDLMAITSAEIRLHTRFQIKSELCETPSTHTLPTSPS